LLVIDVCEIMTTERRANTFARSDSTRTQEEIS
jgi:hypothetical protein